MRNAPTSSTPEDPAPSERTILILGGAGGIGSALTRLLTRRGIRVVAAGRTPASLEALSAETGCDTKVVDARDFGAVEAVVREIHEQGTLAGAVNCVGSILLKPAHLVSESDFDETVGQNLRSAFALVRAVARVCSREKGDVRIALLSTAAASIGLPNHEAIAAAKAGIEGLVRSAAATYARAGIRINAVAPGLVDTPLAARITSNERALEMSRSLHALGRIGQPDDVAKALDWLLDPATDWVTGQVIGVDGGLSSVRAP
ncbi:MAG: SDR family oxidoreductase [Gemmatimonadetes bacterium]|nr:SDR family oxidoreductase [Gemmatimonadota bacterium]